MIQPNIPDSPFPRVVIVGAGFAGINLVKALRKKPFQVVLINQNNYHLFQPLLYQVATAGLEASSIAFPIRGIFSYNKNFIFRLAEVTKINPEGNNIQTTIGEIKYDYLVDPQKSCIYCISADVVNKSVRKDCKKGVICS